MSAQSIKALNKSIVKFVEDVQTSTLDKVYDFVKDHVADKEKFDLAFDEFKKSLKQTSIPSLSDFGKKNAVVTEKKKRPASSYNLFIGEKIKELKQSNMNDNGKDLMKKAIELWKLQKASAPAPQ